MDSGSTIMAVLLVGSVLAFLGLHGADAALPLLRRAYVRDSLPEEGLRPVVIRRLRSSRGDYEDLVWLLTLTSVASASALALGVMARATQLPWPAITGLLVVLWLGLLLLVPVIEYLVARLSVGQLVTLGVVVQLLLWPLLPIRVLSRSGLRLAGRSETNGHWAGTSGTPETVRPESQVEEEIADEPLERHERRMIHAILHLDETPVREIMVPRVDVVSLEVGMSLEQSVMRMLESGHSRLPVYEDNPDNIVGILYSRDLLAATTRGNSAAPPALPDLVRPCFFVPESKRVDEMLAEFQERRVHLAVVVDEYGGVAGIVTIEDLLEEIVGEIEDEFDVDEPRIEHRESGEAVVDARMPVDKFNEEFNTAINPEGFDTIGGFLFSRLGRIPTAGDLVTEKGLRMEVITTVGRRIKKVHVVRPTEPVGTQTHAEESSGPSV